MMKKNIQIERKPRTNFGRKLKAAGISLYACAKAAGTSATLVSLWYYGNGRPSVSDKFIAMCEWLETQGVKVTLRDFVRFDNDGDDNEQ